MPRIDRIRIHHFRGASAEFDVRFAKGKKLVVIFGENGTGKTTIVDALDAVGNCSGGSLTTKSSTTLKDHLPTAGKKPADMIVEVSAGGTTWQATLKRNEIVTTPTLRPAIRVLRRTHLQRFIDSQPAKRYEEVRQLIGVEQVERAEGALKRASDGVKQQLDDAARTRANAEDQLQRIWLAEGCPDHDWRTWAESEASQDGAGLTAQARNARATGEAIGEALRAKDEWERAEDLLVQREQELATIEEDHQTQPGIDARSAMKLAEILGEVRKHLEAGEPGDQCPVCRQDIDLNALKSDLDRRLEELSRYQALSAQRQSAQRQLQTAVDVADSNKTELIAAASRMEEMVERSIPGIGMTAAQSQILAAINHTIGDLTDPLARAAASVTASASYRERLLAESESAANSAGRVNAIRELNAGVEESKESTIELERVLKGLAAAHDLVKSTRIEYTQRILDEVADECNRLYAALHPNEGLAISKVELDQRQRASLNQVGVAPLRWTLDHWARGP